MSPKLALFSGSSSSLWKNLGGLKYMLEHVDEVILLSETVHSPTMMTGGFEVITKTLKDCLDIGACTVTVLVELKQSIQDLQHSILAGKRDIIALGSTSYLSSRTSIVKRAFELLHRTQRLHILQLKDCDERVRSIILALKKTRDLLCFILDFVIGGAPVGNCWSWKCCFSGLSCSDDYSDNVSKVELISQALSSFDAVKFRVDKESLLKFDRQLETVGVNLGHS